MTHGKLTSLPRATVTFGMGSANIGGSESAATCGNRSCHSYASAKIIIITLVSLLLFRFLILFIYIYKYI